MTTLTAIYPKSTLLNNNVTLSTRYNQFIKQLEFSHFGLIAMAILIGSCLGGITAMQIFEHHAPLWQFIICLGFTMTNLVACIGQASTKWVVNLFALCIIVNLIFLLTNVL